MPNSNKQPWPLLLLPRFTQRVTIIVAVAAVDVVVVVCPRWQSIFVCVCVSVCVHVCVYVHIYVGISICESGVRVCVCVCMYVCWLDNCISV